MSIYDNGFFEYLREKSRKSALEIVPIICDLIKPNSVVDVGCGTATWLAVFQEHGVKKVFGIDGDYVNREKLEIDLEKFYPFDLKQPLCLDEKFELAVSLEVAEHLPADVADTFINSLTKLSPIVLFSAAIPEQGGVEHINEQWQDYWVEKFANQGYEVIDCLRTQIWQNENVSYWYAQNILLFVEGNYLQQIQSSELYKLWQKNRSNSIRLVHPNKYLEVSANYQREYNSAQWYAAELEKYKAAAEVKKFWVKKLLFASSLIARKTIFKTKNK